MRRRTIPRNSPWSPAARCVADISAADIGFTGANFAIAETGMISITENEGNARLTAALPKTMVSLLGIEKILPRLEDLALFLPMLRRRAPASN